MYGYSQKPVYGYQVLLNNTRISGDCGYGRAHRHFSQEDKIHMMSGHPCTLSRDVC